MFSRQDLLPVLLLLAAAVLLGSFTGAYGWCFFAALAMWSGLQLRDLKRLSDWSKRPLRRPDNIQPAWQTLSTRLFRTVRQSRARSRNIIGNLRALRTITDALPDAALVVSSDGVLRDFNAAARSLLNLRKRDRGQSLASVVRQPSLISLSKGQINDELVEFTSPLHESIRLEARRVPMPEDQSLLLVRDVTQLNRLLSMRQDFIANVSHELRTPLTVIVGYIETLLAEDLDRDTTLELVEKLRSPTTRMRALVDDLLLLTRLESSPNPNEAELATIDMRNMMNVIASDGRALSGGRHDIRCSGQSTALVIGIERELLSACLNLLTNAIRYSPDGGEIELRWEDLESGARFSVSDQGIGIPPEHLSRITERFYRVDLAKSRVRGGTGLGLAIVKHVLKRHQSELQIDSELSKGSTFYCDFPESQLSRVQPLLRESG
jgi:two-component system phosphate regulon sensor histidine kinase PhoR